MTDIHIPDMTDADLAFGNIKHMPRYDTLPEDFRRHRGNVYTEAISSWFFSGVKFIGKGDSKEVNGIEANVGYRSDRPVRFVAKPGINAGKALRAIRAILASWEPKHEHKEGGAAYLLSQWFDIEDSNGKETEENAQAACK